MKIFEPSDDAIWEASEAIRRGELVGMPTETVYGLAADATNVEAVRRIFEAKRRPSDNPLIVHVASMLQVATVAADIPAEAVALGEAFWPGPFTLVLPKRSNVPSEVTAGLPTVAVRVPDHAIALKLIQVSERPLAAPSANTFMSLSPTRALDIEPKIMDKLTMILDGGPTTFGIESTVVQVLPEVRILRPGSISRKEIEMVLGREIAVGSKERLSPGQYDRHYAPSTPVRLVHDLDDLPGLGFLVAGENQINMPSDAASYATVLYSSLRQLDELGLEAIYVERPPVLPEWEAVWDRLRKAST